MVALPKPERPKKKPTKAERKKALVNKITDDMLLQDGIQRVVMGVREELMSYFKGDCIEKFSRANVSLSSVKQRGGYFYERHESSLANPMALKFYGTVLATVRHNEDEITFFPSVMNRSPEFRVLYEQIQMFLDKYLQGVKVKEDTESDYNLKSNGSTDKDYFMEIARQASSANDSTGSEYYDEYTDVMREQMVRIRRWQNEQMRGTPRFVQEYDARGWTTTASSPTIRASQLTANDVAAFYDQAVRPDIQNI